MCLNRWNIYTYLRAYSKYSSYVSTTSSLPGYIILFQYCVRRTGNSQENIIRVLLKQRLTTCCATTIEHSNHTKLNTNSKIISLCKASWLKKYWHETFHQRLNGNWNCHSWTKWINIKRLNLKYLLLNN